MISQQNDKKSIIYEKLFALQIIHLQNKIIDSSYDYLSSTHRNNIKQKKLIYQNTQQQIEFVSLTCCYQLLYDIIKYNLHPLHLCKISPFILCNILYKSLYIRQYNNHHIINTRYLNYHIMRHYTFKKYLFFEILLLYLSNIINQSRNVLNLKSRNQLALFCLSYSIIINDLIFNVSNIIEKCTLINNIALLSYQQNISIQKYNLLYSNRYIANIKNQIIIQYYIDYYILEPVKIYENRYLFNLVEFKNIYNKNLIIIRNFEIKLLRISQLLITFLFEAQDFIIPKIQYSIYIIFSIPLIAIYTFMKNILIPTLKQFVFTNKLYH